MELLRKNVYKEKTVTMIRKEDGMKWKPEGLQIQRKHIGKQKEFFGWKI